MKRAKVKVVVLGQAAVGKTSIVNRFVHDKFSNNVDATIGVAFVSKSVKRQSSEEIVNFDIWDTAGQERYHSLAPMFTRGAVCGIVVYDITNLKSYERAKKWITELRSNSQVFKEINIILVGNKCDLTNRRIDTKTAKSYANDEGLLFLETSAKNGKNVEKIFIDLANNLDLDAIDSFINKKKSDTTAFDSKYSIDEGNEGNCKC